MKKVFKTMAFTLLGLVLSVNLGWAADVTYKLEAVTSVTAGEKYVFEQSSHVAIGSVSSSALQTTATYATTNLKGNETYVWTLETATDGFYIKNVNLTSNQYLNNSSSTSVSLGTKSSIWTITFTDKIALLSNKSNSNRFLGYTSATSYAYKAYATTNLDSYAHAITVYKLVEEGDTPSDPVDPTVTFSEGEVKATKTLDLSTLYSSNSTGTVTYSITEGGAYATLAGSILTGVSEGAVTVKASQAAATGYNAKETTATITVTAAPMEVVYSLVTDASKLEEGQKIIIVNSGADKALSSTQNSNNRSAVTVTCVDNKISVEEGSGVQVITLGKAQKDSKNYWTLGVDDGYLYAASSSSNYLKTQATLNDNGKWDISISDNIASITAQGTNTRNQLKNNGDIFSCYSSGQTAVKIFAAPNPPTNEAVTFAAPADGSLVIKNGATPIATGATIQDGTVLDVTFDMTPAEAYKDVAIKVTNTSTSEDVTSTVYNSETQKITMPRYPIAVAVTFTKLYKISLVKAGEGEGTATMNGVTTDIYVDGDTQIELVANATAPNEFTSWSATENIAIDEEADAETYAYARGDGTITATFGVSALLPLDAPTLSAPTNITYSGVTLNWEALAHADAYNVEILLDNEVVTFDASIGETYWTPDATLQANTTYTYTVQGVGDGSTYAEENNPKAQSTFTTADYPAATLTLSENGETRDIVGKLNTPINLPTTSTQACDGKVFVGWSATTIDGEVDAEPSLLGTTYTFTNPEQLTATIYAVYAKEEKGTTTWNIATSIVAGDVIVFSTNTSSDYRYTAQTIASNIMPCAASTYSDDKSQITTLGDGTQQYTVGGNSENGFTFATAGGYLYISADKKVDVKNTATTWSCSINESTKAATISQKLNSDTYYLKFNPNVQSGVSTNPRFTVYKSGQQDIVLYKKTTGASSYEKYCTTCVAAIVPPTFSLEEGEYDEAQTLELTAAEGAIYYTINGGTETLYEEAIELDERGTFEISAYAKVDDRTSEIVTKTYTLNWAYTLAELVAEGAPTSTGRTVTVILTDEVIESIVTSGDYKNGFYTMVGDKKIEVYCKNSPATWEVGGKVSGTVTCPWKDYQGTWELCPTDWNWASYTAPAKITSLIISGDVTNKEYTAGQKLDFTGLTVTGVYSDNTEQVSHKEDVTADVVWTEVTLTENQTEATATATLNNVKTGNIAVSQSKTIEGLTVGAAKTLESIYVADDSEHKTAFFVGRPFSAEGLKVMAHYNIGDDQQIALANLDIDNPTFSAPEAEHAINISYTENSVTKNTSYNVAVTYMNLSDLVAEDVPTNTSVKVAFSDVEITGFYKNSSDKRAGVYVNVIGKNGSNIELYSGGTPSETLNGWQEGGKIASKGDYITGTWKYYDGGSVWEIDFGSNYAWSTNIDYTAPNIPVTSMEISPAEVSVGEGATTTLSIVYTPTNATNTGVTWAVTEGSDYASVDAETGEVTGIAVGTATITATLTADPSITATRTVTVTETPKCEISYYVRGSVASTQTIAREEEGTLTYVPELVVAGYTFAGWAEAAIAEETATATLISTYTPAADEATKSVYAIYKRVDDSSPTYQQYAKVTSALTDWVGDYLIAYDATHFANGKTGGEDGMGKQYASVSPSTALSGNVVTKEWGDQYKVTLEEISVGSNTYVLKTQDGNYNYQTSNANGLSATKTKATAAAYPITVTFTSENDVKLALGGNAAGAVFRYNEQGYFRYYKDGGQKAVYLYKYDEGAALYTSNPVAKVKVTFNLDGGVGGCGTITVNEGEDVTLCEEAPTKDLNKFDAWSDGVNEYAPSATITHVTEDIELTALWIAKKQYTISFNKGGAAGTTPDAITDYEYNVVTLPAQGDLSNPGYIFGGWNDGETTYAGGATFTIPEKNVTMTAVWVARTNDKWVLVTSADQLVAGKKYVIANNENDAVAGDITGTNKYMNKLNATFSDNKQFITAMAGQVELTLGGSTDAWTFAKDASNYLANSGTDLSWSTTASTWKIAFEDGKMTIVEGTNNSLQYNTSSPRFKTYTSAQAAVQLYVLVPAQAINEEVNASTLDDHADVTVNEDGNLLVTDGDIELGDIYVMAGGKVTIQGTATLTVNNFVIKSSMGAGQSGQVIGVTTENFTITGSAYFDVTLGDNGNPEKWHAFAVPFNVDAINDIYDLDDNKLTNEVNYAIMDYHGDVRAQGQYGWKKFRGIMQPGVFYLMTVDGERTTYRMKMNGGFSASSSTISVSAYSSSTTTDAGWNGIANNQLGYSSVGVNVQVLNPTSYTYEVMTASTYNFTVGTPFFYQASETGSIDLTAPNAGANYAPRMEAEAKNIAVTLGNDKYTDRLYISATDEATNEYQIGRDLVKMTMTNAPTVPQIFAEAYGTKLCMVDAPMMYDEAVYALNLYAPANGEYTIGAAQVEGYEVFLTQYGNVIWNLSMSEATVELTKGNNAGYGLILKATSGHAPTDINTINGQESVQKFLYNSNIYIRHDNKTFNVTGQLVK